MCTPWALKFCCIIILCTISTVLYCTILYNMIHDISGGAWICWASNDDCCKTDATLWRTESYWETRCCGQYITVIHDHVRGHGGSRGQYQSWKGGQGQLSSFALYQLGWTSGWKDEHRLSSSWLSLFIFIQFYPISDYQVPNPFVIHLFGTLGNTISHNAIIKILLLILRH